MLLETYGPLWAAITATILTAYLYEPVMLHVRQREVELYQEHVLQGQLKIQKTIEELEKAKAQTEAN